MTQGPSLFDPLTTDIQFARDMRFLQVSFFASIYAPVSICLGCVLFAGCQPEAVRQEKEQRRQLVHELRHHSYATAAPLARQLLQRKPKDERLWRQLIRAQLGLHDLEGAKDTLRKWRAAIPTPSPRANEFEGDIAREERNSQLALDAWNKAVQAQPNNVRVRSKLAALQQSLGRWAEAETTWGNVIQLKDSATSRVN